MTRLSEALSNWLKAVNTYNKAMDVTDHDHSHFTYRERERMADAEGRFLDALEDALDDRRALRRN